VANVVFGFFKRLTARTETTLDDELIVAWQKPVAAFIAVLGAVIAIKVLKLSPEADAAFLYLKTIAFAVVGLWFFINTVSSILDHLPEAAKAKGAAVAAFMPWIKKTVIALFLVFGVLIAAQSLGADVKAFLAGLGIGGLAFALAAQDTLANVFGSVVVAVDQPFRIGEFVQIGTHQGTVEDIGLRSTKLRTPQRTLIAIPNKTVAADAINNFSRMPQRRVDQTIGLTYSSKSHQIEGLLEEIRSLLKNDPAVHKDFIAVNFLNYGAFSLDIQIIYFAADPDPRKTFDLRERINLSIMRMVEARGLSFAFPTQTIEFSGPIAERLAAGRSAA
jgi:MscS family membrane protein